MILHCKPNNIFTWNSVLSGAGHRAELTFNWYGESGSIALNGQVYDIQKCGMFSGSWIMTNHSGTSLTAEKLSVFSRTFTIQSPLGNYQLKAPSAFSRTMTLDGRNGSVRIEPDHIFTRRSTISGQLDDIEVTCFATWLCLLVRRRNAKNSN
ncbi:hypothetical protein JIN77_01670 [Verrucomicrobiaceae bacterium R5-34]|nr:hypothetical protein [Verrucomicrobiaceae bacterium R5-34]